MEIWLIWALVSAVIWGFYNFTFKVIAQRQYDNYLVTCCNYAIAAGIVLIYILFTDPAKLVSSFTLHTLIIASALNIGLYSLSIFSRVESMRYIDSVIFFPLYKTFGPILVTMISIYWFKEGLSYRDILWIIVWITVPLLLITKTEDRIQKNLYRWVIFVLITTLLTSISTIFPKYAQVVGWDIPLFLLFNFIFGIIFSYIAYRTHLKKEIQEPYKTDGILKFCIISGILHVFVFYAYMRAMEWNLAVVFTINSFSILIPIILSIIFYWEHFNLKKGIVIALSIVSILLFL